MIAVGRSLARACLRISLLVGAIPAHALMAGAAPDSANARIDANTPASSWTAAVSISIDSGIYSGVVVAPRYVLTAAHVAAGRPPSAVNVQINITSTPIVIGAASITVFPSASFPYDDLALIELSTAVPGGVHIPPIFSLPLPPGQPITLVGYGSSGNGDGGPSVGGLAGVKRSGRNVVDAVQRSVDGSGRSSLFYLFDFDGPTGNGPLGGPTLGNALETGLAIGDSGSPAFATISGQTWLIGIDNFVFSTNGNPADSRFGTGGGGILLSDPRFISWLQAQTGGGLGEQSASDGDIPLPPWALAALALALGAPLASRRRGPATRLTSCGSADSRS